MAVRSASYPCAVFTCLELPQADQAHLRAIAQRLGWSEDIEAALRAPLVLAPARPRLAQPGLLDEAQILRQGRPAQILAARLVLCDALEWPELRDAGLVGAGAPADLIVYTADPAVWTARALADALAKSGRWQPRLGVTARPRLPRPACERVPVLGHEVPLFGARLTDASIRDLRAPEDVRHRAEGTDLPAGLRPAHEQGDRGLYLRVTTARIEGDTARVAVELTGTSPRPAEQFRGTLRLRLDALERIYDLEQWPAKLPPGALHAHLSELLPHCLLLTPDGGLLVFDLFGLGIHAVKLTDTDPSHSIPKLRLAAAPRPESDGAPDDAPITDRLDPAGWPLDVLWDLIESAKTELGPEGLAVTYRLSGQHDGSAIETETRFAL